MNLKMLVPLLAIAVAVLVALLEQCQDADGNIAIPEALQPYFGEATL